MLSFVSDGSIDFTVYKRKARAELILQKNKRLPRPSFLEEDSGHQDRCDAQIYATTMCAYIYERYETCLCLPLKISIQGHRNTV